jgi:hypothetical protein
MNFNQLLAKMQELDQPLETTSVIEEPLQDCGPMPTPQSSMPDTPPPSMSINLNAQGLDNIEDLMKLIKAVNPEMDKPMMPAPTISISPMDKPMDKPMGLPPLKMLPDLDKDEGDMSTDYNKDGQLDAHEKDHASELPLLRSLDQDKDGDHDMDDHNMQKKEKDEAYGNSMSGSEPETKDMDAAIPDGNDLHKSKKSYSGKPYRGDNPMAAGAFESTDLRAQIRAELLQRLAEAKGAK